MLNNRFILILYLLIATKKCTGDICETCLCSIKDDGPMINCHDKELGKNDMLNFELLTLDDSKMPSTLVLSKNEITEIPSHTLKKLKRLRSLDLSQNHISELHAGMYADLSNLEDLNLSNNSIEIFDVSVITVIPAVTTLNLSHNRIANLENTNQSVITKITSLDLSYNIISTLSETFFNSLSQLQYLDLSFNNITTLNFATFLECNSLYTLLMNNNNLTTLDMQDSAKSLKVLDVGHNLITSVTCKSSQIEILNIEYNYLSNMNNDLRLLENLKQLNVSGNIMLDFPNVTLHHLRTLDLSYNNLTSIPDSISIANFPGLETLIVNGNSFKSIMFSSELILRKLTAGNMKSLRSIDENAFSKLQAPPGECMNLTVSDNERLTLIHAEAFQHLNVCYLDLSNNHIAQVSSQLMRIGDNLTEGFRINLQGNPFECNCSLQWMLDDFVPWLYYTDPTLLENLRCALPAHMANIRMVHWYKWSEKVFCKNAGDFSEKLTVEIASILNKEEVTFESSPGLLAAIGTAITLLTILVIVGIVLTRRKYMKKRRLNRRF